MTVFQLFIVCFIIQIGGVWSLKNVLNVVKGSIGAGNYTYFMLKYEVVSAFQREINQLLEALGACRPFLSHVISR